MGNNYSIPFIMHPYQDHLKLQENTLLFKALSFYRETNCCQWIIGESTLFVIGEYNSDGFGRFIGEQTVELQANHPSPHVEEKIFN